VGYIISSEAAIDLDNIWLYTFENWSKEQADRYLNLLLDEIEYLALRPDAGKDFGNTRTGYRSSKVKSHLIFYRHYPGQSDIEIIRILHQRMDLERQLFG